MIDEPKLKTLLAQSAKAFSSLAHFKSVLNIRRPRFVLHTTFRSTVRPATMDLVALDAPSGQEKVSRDMP